MKRSTDVENMIWQLREELEDDPLHPIFIKL